MGCFGADKRPTATRCPAREATLVYHTEQLYTEGSNNKLHEMLNSSRLHYYCSEGVEKVT